MIDFIHLGAEMQSYMDVTVSPCDSFYKFVCGNFSRNAVFPNDSTAEIGGLNQLVDLTKEKLKASIENNITASDPETFKKIKILYDVCMDECKF